MVLRFSAFVDDTSTIVQYYKRLHNPIFFKLRMLFIWHYFYHDNHHVCFSFRFFFFFICSIYTFRSGFLRSLFLSIARFVCMWSIIILLNILSIYFCGSICWIRFCCCCCCWRKWMTKCAYRTQFNLISISYTTCSIH